ncbi:MAG: aminotransferase class III-fold pyridoxal phosphate-dependent enzyme [Candidatus Babeliales bacterium]|jgi:glutamate-1-semialdehyde 2,1-aminomutase
MKHYATYSRSQDCFPENAPDTFISGKGCHVTAEDGREFIDWGMGLRAVLLGYCYPAVDEAAKKAIDKGVCFTRSSPYENELREIITQELKLGEECKFGKNGSDATHAAVKLARAYTERDIVLIAEENPFISTADFFIGTTPVNDGIPRDSIQHAYVDTYTYSNMQYGAFPLEQYLRCNHERVAAIILDPATVDITKEKLQYIRDLCDKYGIIMILDETISGFRYDIRGVQGLYGIKPDLACYGKGVANGYAVSIITGRKELFDLGLRGKGNVFLLSGTYFSNTPDLAAAIACIDVLKTWKNSDFEQTAHERLNSTGNVLITFINDLAGRYGLKKHVSIDGFPSCPMMHWKDIRLKTIFDWQMIENSVLMPYIAPCLSHNTNDVLETLSAVDYSFNLVKSALEYEDLDKFIEKNCGNWVEKPVFRKV